MLVSEEKQREMRLSRRLSSIRPPGRMPSNIQSSLVPHSDRFVTFFIITAGLISIS